MTITVKEWLNNALELKYPWAKSAIEQTPEQNGMSKALTMSDALQIAFNWSESKEGKMYWDSVKIAVSMPVPKTVKEWMYFARQNRYLFGSEITCAYGGIYSIGNDEQMGYYDRCDSLSDCILLLLLGNKRFSLGSCFDELQYWIQIVKDLKSIGQ